jgi:diguanylate cyclase (GGDEF)-like protein
MFLKKRAIKTDEEEKRLKMLEEISRDLDMYIEHGWGLHRDHTFELDSSNPISQLQEKLYRAFERVHDEEILDVLTRSWNRKFMAKMLEGGLKVAQRENQNFCVALIDIDGLKHIMDYCGIPTGDHVLVELAKRLQKEFHPGDWVGRVGGDEFQIALHQDLEHAQERLERFRLEIEENSLLPEDQREGLSKYLTENGMEHKVTVSIGLTAMQPNDTLEDCITRTDIAMHCAKNQGKNRLEVF